MQTTHIFVSRPVPFNGKVSFLFDTLCGLDVQELPSDHWEAEDDDALTCDRCIDERDNGGPRDDSWIPLPDYSDNYDPWLRGAKR